jgi:hypothetical protein
MKQLQPQPHLYGLMAEFEDPQSLLNAAHAAYEHGYRKMDAYAPFPVEGLSEAIGFHKTKLPMVVLAGGVLGCVSGYMLQYWTSAIDFPINVGGRPYHSWPSFIPITFEVTVLFAAFAAVFGMLGLNGLPQPYHPVFNVARFALATKDRFFLCIEATDSKFDRDTTWRFLDTLQPRHVSEVEQ